MDTLIARMRRPAPLAVATVVAALIGLALVLALGAELGGSHDVEPLLGPFRWLPTDPFVA